MIEFAECGPDRLEALRSFFAQVYRPDYVLRADDELFRWQFGSHVSAIPTAYRVKLALVDGCVAGCLGYIPAEISVSGAALRGAWTANWMIDPDRRRLGLGPILMRELMREHDITLTVGLTPDASSLLPRMGWSDRGELTRHIHLLNQQAAAALTETGTVTWPVHLRPLPITRSRKKVVRVVRFADDVTRLWDRGWGTLAAGTRRSAEFLNWRYADHPTFDYRLLEAHSGDGLAGIAVYRIEQVKHLPVSVARLIELVSSEAAASSLLSTVTDDARSEGAALVDFFCSSRSIVPVLTRHGFLFDPDAVAQFPTRFQPIDRRQNGIRFMVYTPSPLADGTTDWYVTSGDGDQDRPN